MKKHISLFIIFMVVFISKINAYSQYKIGDKIIYKNSMYYVISDSKSSDESVLLIKEKPLLYNEIISIINSTEVKDNISVYANYLESPYYLVSDCRSTYDVSGCSNDYSISNIKQIVDTWANNYLDMNDLIVDNLGYKVRLITLDELTNNLGYELGVINGSDEKYVKSEQTPSWIYEYNYWTMSDNKDSNNSIYSISGNSLDYSDINSKHLVRPVISLKKSAIAVPKKSINYGGFEFYIVSENEKNKTVTLLKKDPIKSSEIIPYLKNTELASKVNITGDYLTMAYSTKSTCISSGDTSGCVADYTLSDIKQVVDIWANNNLNINELTIDSLGFKTRLITLDELLSIRDLDIKMSPSNNSYLISLEGNWLNNYNYWTMSNVDESNEFVWCVFTGNGGIGITGVYRDEWYVKPVITLKRSAIYGEDNSKDSINEKMNDEKVIVKDTYQKKSLIIILIGFIMLLVGIITYYSVTKVLKERK